MKKCIALLLAALLAAMSCAALAETTLTPVAELEDAEFISNTDLLRVRGKNGYVMATIEGTPLTEANYSSLSGSYGWITLSERSDEAWTNGLAGEDGAIVIPCRYADIDVLNENWALAVSVVESTQDNYDYTSWSSDAVYLIDTVDVYWLPEAKCVSSFPREHFNGAKAYGTYINIEDRADGSVTCYDAGFNALGQVKYTSSTDYIPGYTTFSDNGQQGLMDAEGNVVFPATFKYVYTELRDGCFMVSTGDKYGLANVDGQLLVPAEYDSINGSYYAPYANGVYPYIVNGYVCVIKDGKMGYYNVDAGVESCPPRYAKDNLTNCGVTAYYTEKDGTFMVLAADGTETALGEYVSAHVMDYSAGMYYRVEAEGDHTYYGLVDWHGNLVLPCEYGTIKLSGSGKYLLVQKNYGDPVQVFAVECDDFAETAPVAAPVETAGAEGAEADAEPAGDSAVRTLVESAAGLLESDVNSAVALLENAQALCEDAQVNALLASVVTLLKADPTSTAAAATLLETALSMLP